MDYRNTITYHSVSVLFSGLLWREWERKLRGKKGLLEGLKEVVLGAKAETTTAAYLSVFKQFKEFMTANGLAKLGDAGLQESLFLAHLVKDKQKSASTVAVASSGINWVRSVRSGRDQQRSAIATSVVSAAKRQCPLPKKKIEATKDHLRALATHFAAAKTRVMFMTLTFASVLYFGCLRVSDVRKLPSKAVPVQRRQADCSTRRNKNRSRRRGRASILQRNE